MVSISIGKSPIVPNFMPYFVNLLMISFMEGTHISTYERAKAHHFPSVVWGLIICSYFTTVVDVVVAQFLGYFRIYLDCTSLFYQVLRIYLLLFCILSCFLRNFPTKILLWWYSFSWNGFFKITLKNTQHIFDHYNNHILQFLI